jgi:hypothetical protein
MSQQRQPEPSLSIARVLRLSLEAAGIEFIPQNGGGVGVRLRKKS